MGEFHGDLLFKKLGGLALEGGTGVFGVGEGGLEELVNVLEVLSKVVEIESEFVWNRIRIDLLSHVVVN